jgi:hypothetical protein
VEIPGGVDQGTTFTVKATFYREDASGAKEPILEKSAVRIELPEGFKVQSENISSAAEGQHIYQIVVPMVEGEFPITLIYDNQKEVPSRFGYKINVVNPVSYYLSAVIVIGLIVAVALTLGNTFVQSWKI